MHVRTVKIHQILFQISRILQWCLEIKSHPDDSIAVYGLEMKYMGENV